MCYHLEGILDRNSSELFDLLSSPHIHVRTECENTHQMHAVLLARVSCYQALLLAHDKVANKEYPATLLAKEQENDKDKKQFRHVRIDRYNAEPLVWLVYSLH